MKTFVICFLVVVWLVLLSIIIPIKNDNGTSYVYDINVTYVNQDKRTITLTLPDDFEYYIYANKGSYGLELYSHEKTIWGERRCEKIHDIPGVLYINYIKRR